METEQEMDRLTRMSQLRNMRIKDLIVRREENIASIRKLQESQRDLEEVAVGKLIENHATWAFKIDWERVKRGEFFDKGD